MSNGNKKSSQSGTTPDSNTSPLAPSPEMVDASEPHESVSADYPQQDDGASAPMDWDKRTINPTGNDAASSMITDASCYSHSPPDMPLSKYNNYRKTEFEKQLKRKLLALLNDKIAKREKYFYQIHKRYPAEGSMNSMVELCRLEAHRSGSSNRLDESCSCAEYCNRCTVPN